MGCRGKVLVAFDILVLSKEEFSGALIPMSGTLTMRIDERVALLVLTIQLP